MTENRENQAVNNLAITQGAPVGVVDIDATENLPVSEAKIGVGAASSMNLVRPIDGVGIVKNVLRRHPHTIRNARFIGILPQSRELIDPEGTYVKIQDAEDIEIPTNELGSLSEASTTQALTRGQTGISRVRRVVVEIISSRSVESLGLGDIFKNQEPTQESKATVSQFPNMPQVEKQDLAA